jgi:peptidoglycan-N-acetylglucosamine deacetylase
MASADGNASMTFGRALLYIATAAGFALLARTLIQGPVPVWVSVIALLGYAAIVLLGVFWPQLGMYGHVLWHGPEQAEVVLTFDDGPHPEHTMRVLDRLDAAGVQATFFVIGRKVRAHPQVALQIMKRGHKIGVHGDQHDRWMTLRTTKRITEDLTRCIEAVEQATGVRPRLFRPPVGLVSPRVAQAADRLNLQMVLWSVRGKDGVASSRADRIVARVTRGVRPGAIVMLHDAAERDDRTPLADKVLPRVLDAISARGLKIVALDQWMRAQGGPKS